MSVVSPHWSADEDSLELHKVLLELEDVEKQICGLLDKQAQLLERRTALETSCASAYTSKVPGILKQDESIGAVVLHAGANDIRLRQTEVLKRDFASLIDTVRGRSPTTKIIISGPLPTYRRGAEKFSRLLALNDWLVSWCNKQNLLFVNWNLFWECPWLFLACTPAASERNCCQTTSPRHYAPSDCIPLLGLRLLLRPTRLHIKP
ncbi:uncharacterized protein LOC128605952 isoform X2 [Ictalurus furcatus]|uniref:uncharacterized protein LOC128605952 isoform X2 n=1 Tax=Ictalurus furcatus TaxID=66913 RepID=UPI00234FEA63|nr:uncharacterized protein LOC128605952 isoform X2 [Ictalurus furcatus]